MKLLGLLLIHCVFTKKTEGAKKGRKFVKIGTGKNIGSPEQCAPHVQHRTTTKGNCRNCCRNKPSYSDKMALDQIPEKYLLDIRKRKQTETGLHSEKYLWRREGSQEARDITHHRRSDQGLALNVGKY